MARTDDDEQRRRTSFLIRRRVGMAPLWAGLCAALAAAGSFSISREQTFALALLLVGASCWLADRRWGARQVGVRNFAWLIIVAAGAFVLLVRYEWLPWWANLLMLALTVSGLGILWWTDPANRRMVKRERDQERWPILAKRLNMPQVHRGPEQSTETGRRWKFSWAEGTFTVDGFRGRMRELESALGIPVNHGRIKYVYTKPGQKNPNEVYVEENTQSKNLDAPVDFDVPTMRSICDPMYIGPFEDGERHLVTWFDREYGGMHTLAGGATGSGKSGLYHLVMAESAYCPDLVRWGIDAKGGMALRPWASLFDWMIDDADDAIHMLNAVHVVLKDRSKYAADRGWDVWQASAEHPVIVVIVDEAAEVFGIEAFDMNALGASVARMGRAAGVLFLIATQHPTNEALASTQLTKNLRRRFCFSVEDMAAQSIIIPKSSGKIDATDIPVGKEHAGTYFCSDGGRLYEKSARVRFVTKFDIFRLTVQIGADQELAVPGLDELSRQAAMRATADGEGGSIYGDRRIWTADDIMIPMGWTGALPAGFTGQGGDSGPATSEVLVPAGAPRGVDPAVSGDETFDDSVLNGPRTTVQQEWGVPDRPEQGEAGAPAPSRDAPEQAGAQPVTQSGQEQGMLLGLITEPRSEEEEIALDKAVAQYVATYSERSIPPERAQRMLDEMLVAAPAEGISIEDMRSVLGRSPSWYSEVLRKRIKADLAMKLRTGRYTATEKLRRKLMAAAQS